ncbi:GNAT family N-acetyltransferase [Hymenobacter cheonanensis]|uniref:GNAT family N-acetyltransferase n=1 Tax=Hymenobacter sp. CA2-7 TaxID=3063993 RepID=UPI002712DA4D|nr:GNAT family N-acetyltransferase [Hymenobacter sp. CA2-7]MDO7887269.1 GNAT family N-acetyltransferase [Hymenobacter sp. CA2-7]
MLRHVRHAEINRPQWDALINQAPNGLIYALTWYLDSVAPGWEALVREEGGRYVAGLPLPVQRKFGLRYLKQPLFAQQLGLFSLETPTAADWQQVARLLGRFRVITQYAFNTGNAELLGAGQPGLAGVPFTTYYLSLRPPYAQLLAGYKPNRRWRLNQARRRGLHVEPTTDIDLMVQIFAENTAPKIYGVIGEAYEYRILRALYARARQEGLATMWQVRGASGEVLAMGLLFHFKQHLTYIFNCSTQAGKEAGAISVLLDEVLRAHAGQDLVFDFEAPEVPNVAHFYSSFGPAPAPYLAIAANRLPWPVRQLKAARMALYRRLRPRPAPGH